MRSKILAAVLVTAVMGVASASFAAATAGTGTIKSMDAKAMTVTMQDGTVYKLPADFKIAAFKVGEKVTLTWEMKGTVKDIDTMVAA